MKRDAVGVVEAAYDLDAPEDEWLERLLDAVIGLIPSAAGALIYEFNARAGLTVQPRVWRGVDESFVTATLELNRASSEREIQLFYRSGVITGTVSEMLRATGSSITENETYQESTAARGFPDSWGLTVSGPAYRGLTFNAPLDRIRTVPPAQRRRWLQIGAHVQAAYRLRRRFDRDPEAVLEPSGRVCRLERAAQGSSRRERLQRAVIAAERARTSSGRSEGASGLDEWRALVAGRWTLIESFERDRRRYYTAYPNAPHVRSFHALSPREEQVVAYVAQGDSNKLIAYQLGITLGSVSNSLSRAMAKMGLRTRQELIWLYNQLAQANDPPPPT
jgi:DNA-binding CsgD family transcriptional regulator